MFFLMIHTGYENNSHYRKNTLRAISPPSYSEWVTKESLSVLNYGFVANRTFGSKIRIYNNSQLYSL